MNDFTKAFRMSCSVFPECNRDFQASVWTFPVVVAFARHNGPGSVDSRRLASMMAHPSMEACNRIDRVRRVLMADDAGPVPGGTSRRRDVRQIGRRTPCRPAA